MTTGDMNCAGSVLVTALWKPLSQENPKVRQRADTVLASLSRFYFENSKVYTS